jgi:hypothetical protein
MKEMQYSEAESTAHHPAFSAPGITRHRATGTCCVVAPAFLLSNPRCLSNICFQIGCHSAATPPVLSFLILLPVLGCDGGRPRSTRHQSRALYVPERLTYGGGRQHTGKVSAVFPILMLPQCGLLLKSGKFYTPRYTQKIEPTKPNQPNLSLMKDSLIGAQSRGG